MRSLSVIVALSLAACFSLAVSAQDLSCCDGKCKPGTYLCKEESYCSGGVASCQCSNSCGSGGGNDDGGSTGGNDDGGSPSDCDGGKIEFDSTTCNFQGYSGCLKTCNEVSQLVAYGADNTITVKPQDFGDCPCPNVRFTLSGDSKATGTAGNDVVVEKSGPHSLQTSYSDLDCASKWTVTDGCVLGATASGSSNDDDGGSGGNGGGSNGASIGAVAANAFCSTLALAAALAVGHQRH